MIVPLERRPAAAAVPAGRGRLIAVASGKGGVGKTWFSVTLAHAMALTGQRVLLFDGDLGLANVDVQLGMAPPRDLGTYLHGRSSLADVATAAPTGGFDIIAGRSGSGSLAHVAPSKLVDLRADLQSLTGRYDVVIMDMGAGIERTVRAFALEAQSCLVVATDEPTSITDAYAFIKVTTMERRDADLRIVVNMAKSQRDGEQTYGVLVRACREFLKLEPPLAGVVRRDAHVPESIRKQTSLLTRHPNSEAAADVRTVAAGLFGTG